ncbi:peptidase M24, structural domain-containing protein [Geopyxis carbonaria]|nr:peptidase M24, structural domain-containing protein [Geopyxis carbonaria]
MSDTEEQQTKKVPETKEADYSISNSDTISKYKDAAGIAQRVLAEVTKLAVPGATILSLCQKGDELLEAETAKVYKSDKKMSKGIAFPTTVSPNDIITPYTPLTSEAAEASITVNEGDVLKIQLGAQIDGLPAIISDTIVVGTPTPEQSELIIATHHVTEALIRLLTPPALHPSNTEEKPFKAPTSASINQTLAKIATTYGCKLVESTTTFTLERNEIEGKKKVVVNPGEGVPKSEGSPEIGDVWGVEISLTKGSGKVKEVPGKRATLFRKTDTKFQLKRQSSRQTLTEISKKFGTFPFGMRQLEDERTAKMGIIEMVRGNILRQFEVLGDKDGAIVSRIYVTAAITKNGLVKLAAPPALDTERFTSDKKIEDEEILAILELPVKSDAKKRSRKKGGAKKTEAAAEAAE